MNCDLACHLLDDYVDHRLRRRERERLELHLSDCPQCTEELRERLGFERAVQQALTASVQRLELAPEISRGMVQAVEQGLRQPAWSHQALRGVRLFAGAVIVALLLFSLSLLLGRIPIPAEVHQAIRPPTSQPALSLARDGILVEPSRIQPGDPFTVTVPIHSSQLQSLDGVRSNLEINGPTGNYRFALALQGPVPARGVSILQVTPDMLAGPSQQQYQIPPEEILGVPGIYTFRVTIFSPVVLPVE